MLPALALFWPFVSAQILEVVGEGRCPSSEQVSERVQKILDPGGNRRIEERAILTREGDSLRIVLRAPDGRTLGERVLPADSGCEDLAQIVAVVLAAWISDVHPASPETLPQVVAPTQASNAQGEAAKPPTESSPWRVVAREPELGVAGDVLPPASAARSFTLRRFELGGGVGLEAPWARAAALLSIAWLPTRSGIGWYASATITLPRDDSLVDGKVHWWRWPIATGIVLRTAGENAAFELGAGGAVAWERFAGRGFPSTSTASGFTWGGFASVRVAATRGTITPFASVTAFGWLNRSIADTRPDGSELEVPRFDISFMAGATIGL